MALTKHPLFRLIFVALLVVPMAALAQSSTVGRASGGGPQIEWLPNVSGYESIQLRVLSPDGEAYSKSFTSGRSIAFRVTDLGDKVADGEYTYELRVIPNIPDTVKNALKSARAAGDDAAAKRIMKDAGIGESVVQSGGFRILNGSIVDPNATEGTAKTSAATGGGVTTDANRPSVPVTNTLFTDNVYIQNSLCVGFDCVNGAAFGFDTIRLQENNTRIKFEDTSVGTFPTNDWQFTANDSASGGQSKLSIEDITGSRVPFTVEAGATTNSLYVDSTGRIGFRTSTPVLDLHISTTNTPGIRLEQTNAGGFAAQTWDVAGNEANFFVRDVTGGSRLPFRIRPGAPTSSIDINASGKVGIRTASPGFDVDIRGDSSTSNTTVDVRAGMGPDPTNGPGTVFGYGGSAFGEGSFFFNTKAGAATVAPNPSIQFLTGSTVRMVIDNEGFVGLGVANPASPIQHSSGAILTAGGTWQNASSRALKENVADLDSTAAHQALDALDPVTFDYKVDPAEHHVGFIAEDVPDLVAAKDRKSLSPMDIVAVLTKVVQDQQKTIDQLNQRLDQIEKKSSETQPQQ